MTTRTIDEILANAGGGDAARQITKYARHCIHRLDLKALNELVKELLQGEYPIKLVSTIVLLQSVCASKSPN